MKTPELEALMTIIEQLNQITILLEKIEARMP